MSSLKNRLMCILSAFLVGCTTMRIPNKQLSSEEFVRLYNNPGTPGDYWEYIGLKDGRHWLYHYGFRQPQQSIVSVIEKGFVSTKEMPEGFPFEPQLKPKPIDSGAVKAGLENWVQEIDARAQEKNH